MTASPAAINISERWMDQREMDGDFFFFFFKTAATSLVGIKL